MGATESTRGAKKLKVTLGRDVWPLTVTSTGSAAPWKGGMRHTMPLWLACGCALVTGHTRPPTVTTGMGSTPKLAPRRTRSKSPLVGPALGATPSTTGSA